MMSDGALSQDEIEALLNNGGGSTNSSPFNDAKLFSDVANIIVDSHSISLSTITSTQASIGNVDVKIGNVANVKEVLTGKVIQAKVAYTGSINGNFYYFLNESVALSIASSMSGAEETEINDSVNNTLAEVFSQIIGGSDNALSAKFGGDFANAPVEISVIEDVQSVSISGDLVVVNSVLSIGDKVNNAPYVFAIDLNLAQKLVSNANSDAINNSNGVDTMIAENTSGNNNNNQLGVQYAEFNSLMPASDVQGTGNIGLLMDVTMNMTVELGRATMTIKDILGLGEGSIIELQKLAGEPVDLLVNGKLIAKGEVVVIDENFGVRVTDIIDRKSVV